MRMRRTRTRRRRRRRRRLSCRAPAQPARRREPARACACPPPPPQRPPAPPPRRPPPPPPPPPPLHSPAASAAAGGGGWRLPRAGGVAEEAGSGCGDCGGCGALARSKDAASLSLSSCEWRMAAQRKQNLTRHLVHCPPTQLTSLHAKHLRESGAKRKRARVWSALRRKRCVRARAHAGAQARKLCSLLRLSQYHSRDARAAAGVEVVERRCAAQKELVLREGVGPWPVAVAVAAIPRPGVGAALTDAVRAVGAVDDLGAEAEAADADAARDARHALHGPPAQCGGGRGGGGGGGGGGGHS